MPRPHASPPNTSGLARFRGLLPQTVLTALFLFPALASAQQVRWQLPDPHLAIGKTSPLELVFENCSPKGDPKLPQVEGLGDFGSPVGRQKQVSIINFRPTNREVFSYFVRPQKAGRIEVPAFEVETNAGTLTVPALSLDVDAEARLSSTGERVDRLVQATLETPSAEVWVGEVFPLRYEILLLGSQQASLASDPSSWTPDGLCVAPWPESQNVRRYLGGLLRVGRLFETQAMAERAGTLDLPPIEIDIELVSGRTFGFFSPFGGGQAERIRIPSNPLKLTVKSLPQPAPAGFTGAVGQFRLESRLTPETVAVGEPVTWNVTVRGTGNWPTNFSFPTRRVPASMRVIEPEVQRQASPDKPFEAAASQDIVIIPQEPGTFEIPALQFSFFNPAKGEYETLLTEPARLVVTGDQPGGTLSTQPQITPSPLGDRPPMAQALPEPGPTTLPRDPIAGHGTSFRPLSFNTLMLASAFFFLALIPFWLVLARKETVRSHPNRARQLAWDDALSAARSVQQPNGNLHDKLLRWQQAIARSQGLALSCPTLADLSPTPLFADERWSTLWREAEATLFGDLPLPADWSERAMAASAAFRPPTVPWRSTFRPAHWFPLSLILLSVSLSTSRADDGRQAYLRGDFPAARAAWAKQVEAHPDDWIARNNLGLALAQEGHWDQATAQWSRAWLAAPRQDDIQWNLTLGLSKASYQAPDLRRILGDTWDCQLASLLSPFSWQLLFLSGCALAAVSVALFLFSRYVRRPTLARGTYPGLLLAILLVGLAGLALSRYGILADPDAALVVETAPLKSVPTDAQVEQVSKVVPPGLVVRQEHQFLGWTKVQLANREIGWLRSDSLFPLHRQPPSS